ncbi:hypothetical protein St703_25220 [Sporolactobacillus terrae]|uniref:Uncharacterized protein n=1 Tax=Sporolactobacillus terrae TaxID=269673 RepID=A0A5K7WZI0_9BACL|nr:hypothetical protein St703_25220 [Sporolactobacillus terrae]
MLTVRFQRPLRIDHCLSIFLSFIPRKEVGILQIKMNGLCACYMNGEVIGSEERVRSCSADD